jgi:glycerophosphoryl diester phosphodiesterase
VSSFYHPSLLRVKQLDPAVKTGVLFAARPIDPCQLARQTGAEYLHPHWHYLDAGWVENAKAQGLGINSYTVNSPDEYRHISDLNIDGIFSDYPDRWR